LNFIGEIHPSSTKGHRFVLVATDYFTKWVDVVPLRNMTHRELIDFVMGHTVYIFGIPQTLTTYQGATFMSGQFKEYASSLGIKLLNSSLYYAQANGQAEASKKTLIKLIKWKIEEKPKRWHDVLNEALWAYRVSQHGAIKVTPFDLVYGQEAVLPTEINLKTRRVQHQDVLSAIEYKDAMMGNIDGVMEGRLDALREIDGRLDTLREIEKEKLKVAKTYNRRLQEKSFQINDLVWKTILPLRLQNNKFGKWLPSWEGPFKIIRIVPENSYFVKDLEGRKLPKALNGKYFKKFYPSVWQGA
jgi:hypothetical protein